MRTRPALSGFTTFVPGNSELELQLRTPSSSLFQPPKARAKGQTNRNPDWDRRGTHSNGCHQLRVKYEKIKIQKKRAKASLEKCPVPGPDDTPASSVQRPASRLLPFVELISVNYGSLMSCLMNGQPVDSFVDHLLHATTAASP